MRRQCYLIKFFNLRNAYAHVLVSYCIDYIAVIKYKFGILSNDSFTALLH